MLEKDVEAYLVRRVKGCGGEAYKFTSPQRRNVPDRLVLRRRVPKPNSIGYFTGIAIFVECKRPGEKCTEGQNREHQRLNDLGFSVYVVDSRESVDNFIKAEFNK